MAKIDWNIVFGLKYGLELVTC